MRKHRYRHKLTAVMAITACASFLVACGSSKSSGGSGGTTPSGNTALGTSDAATGSPVKVGFISDGKSAAIDNTPEYEAAEAAVKYANAYLGGLDGHVIDLDLCQDFETPSGATTCDTQMVDDKVVAVLSGVSGEGTAIYTGLAKSGIPMFAYGSIDINWLTKPDAYVITNGLAALASPPLIAQQKGLKKGTVIVTNVPSASGPVNQLGPILYKNAGVSLNIESVDPSVADMTPQVQSAISKGTQLFSIIGSPNFCVAAAKAIKTLGFSGTTVVIPQCIAPGGTTEFAGMTLATVTTANPNDPDVKLYDAVMSKYAPGVNNGGVAPGGYIVVVSFVRALAGFAGPFTAPAINTAIGAMSKPATLPMGDGATFQCGTKPITITPNICGTQSLVGTLNADGTSTNMTLIDTSPLTKL